MYDAYQAYMGTFNIKTQVGSNAPVTRFQRTGHQGNEWKSLQLNLSLSPNTKVTEFLFSFQLLFLQSELKKKPKQINLEYIHVYLLFYK